MIENIDDNVGRMRAFLDANNLSKNTIFIFTTDNGTSSGASVHNAGMRGIKGSPYEGGHRVPFFLHWPQGGHDKGWSLDMLASHIDLMPTLLSMTQTRHPGTLRKMVTASRSAGSSVPASGFLAAGVVKLRV